MNTTTQRYSAAADALSALLGAVPGSRWGDPSPCEGWTARDVLDHLVSTQRDFLAGQGVDLGPQADLADDPAAAWRAHAERVAAALSQDGLEDREYEGYFGPSTVGATFEQFYVWDMFVHRWDIARATGGDTLLTDEELDRIERGADTFGEALYMEGICRPAAEASENADRQTRVLARLGRTAGS